MNNATQWSKQALQQQNIEYIKVGASDIDGILRGKYVSVDKFHSALEDGLAFCDVVFGWDSNDQLYDNTKFTGWHTAYPDAKMRIDLSTCRKIPFETNTLFFLGEFVERAEHVCPRRLLKRVLAKAKKMGFFVKAALEYEFFVFNETPHSVRQKNYQNLQPFTPGYFGYSVLRSSVHSDFYHQLLDMCVAMDMPIEGLHTETGPGVLEAALAVDEALASADKAMIFKTFTKVLAERNNLMATFMAKWSHELPGQSGHIHTSLFDESGKNVFYAPHAEHSMSDYQMYYLAGLQRYLPEFFAMFAQTVNSYSRLVPGYWAPLNATWGVENRTTALRLIPGSQKSQRVEVRIGSADANPYIALAATIAAGLAGIEEQLPLGQQVKGNAYTQVFSEHLAFPRSLREAAGRLKESQAAKQWFGEIFVEHYAATREWEQREFDRHVTDWELKRYFEII